MSAEMRNRWYAVGLVATGLALAVGVIIPHINTTERGPLLAWFIVGVLLVCAFACFGRGTNGCWLGALIDDRNRMSVSRIQMAAWTILIVSAVFTLAADNIADGVDDPLNINVPEELWVLMGISWISFAGSQLIKNTQINGDAIEPLRDVRAASLVDIVRAEKRGQEDQLDLSKIQMMLLTLVVLAAYIAAIAELMTAGTVVRALPALDGSVITLLAISHAGYLTYKGVPSGRAPTAPPFLTDAATVPYANGRGRANGASGATLPPPPTRTARPPREPGIRV